MARLVDNYQSDEKILKDIAAHGLLTNTQQLVCIQTLPSLSLTYHYFSIFFF